MRCCRQPQPHCHSLASLVSAANDSSSMAARVTVAYALMGALPALLAFATTAAGQSPTTVQLPTFSSFSASTSVSVPDRGSALVGGSSGVSAGQLARGVPGVGHLPGASRLFKNQSLGRDTGGSSLRASVWVHDFQAMDEALLAEARSTATGARPAVFGRVDGTPDRPENNSASAADSVAAIRRERDERRAQERSQADIEIRSLLADGDRARADGKPGVAKLYYQMAARRAPAALSEEIQSRLRNLAETRPPLSTASPSPAPHPRKSP